jgi:hypothetical protein
LENGSGEYPVPACDPPSVAVQWVGLTPDGA